MTQGTYLLAGVGTGRIDHRQRPPTPLADDLRRSDDAAQEHRWDGDSGDVQEVCEAGVRGESGKALRQPGPGGGDGELCHRHAVSRMSQWSRLIH